VTHTGGILPVADVLDALPVALLVRETDTTEVEA
jgi:hypothetical protein